MGCYNTANRSRLKEQSCDYVALRLQMGQGKTVYLGYRYKCEILGVANATINNLHSAWAFLQE